MGRRRPRQFCMLVPSYVLGRLSAAETASVRDHLGRCDRCLSEAVRLQVGAWYLRAALDGAWARVHQTVLARRAELDALLDELAGGPSVRRPEPVRVLVASPSTEARTALRELLARDARFSLAAEAGTCVELVPLVSAHLPDLVVVHLPVPTQAWLDALARAGRWSPKTAVVMVANLDAGRAGRLLVTSKVADDWPSAAPAHVLAATTTAGGRQGGGVVGPKRAPVPRPEPQSSIIREAMRQMGISMGRSR